MYFFNDRWAPCGVSKSEEKNTNKLVDKPPLIQELVKDVTNH